jgi:hypothetical protein
MFQRIKKTYKTIHHHIAHRPHRYLMARGGWYSRWHSWNRGRFNHKHVHILSLGLWVAGGVLLAFLITRPALASGTWTQTNWSGGAGASTSNQYLVSTGITTSAGAFGLNLDQRMANADFESNLNNWRFVAGNGGTYGTKIDYSTAGQGYYMASADFDGDGDIDTVTSNYSNGNVSVLMNNGSGALGTKVDYGTATNPFGITVGDIDSDGDNDIVVTNAGSASVSVLKNNGNGTFATKVDYTTAATPLGVALADIDGDGDLDLIAATQGGGASVLKNNSNGTFAAKNDYAGACNVGGVATGDIDGDGDTDIVLTNGCGSSISVLKNSGTGTFAAKVDYTTVSQSSGIVLTDLDGDGDLDVATDSGNTAFLSILLNSGTGTYGTKTDYAVASVSNTIAAADLDNDGDKDLVVPNTTPGTVSVLKNNSNATFATKIDYTASGGSRGVALADMNADGNIDIMSYNATATISVFLNASDKAIKSSTRAYNNSNSALAVTTGTTGQFLQAKNLGDTNTYVLEAYVYTTGSAVTSADVELYVGSSVVTTTFQSTGSAGWYRLSANVTGTASSRDYGIQVKTAKTAYIDLFRLYQYPTGNLVSNAYDLTYGGEWGVLTYTYSGTGTVAVKVRTSNNADMSGATAFASCSAIPSGTVLAGQSCVTTNQRYVQYEVTLSGPTTTPIFEDINISYSQYDADPPETNASAIAMKISNGGATVASNAWSNGPTPYFSWTAGADSGTGIQGYCLYLGTDNTADPRTAKGLLGTSPINTGGTCPFAVGPSPNIDLAGVNYLGTALTSSNSPYYLSIKAIDLTNNVFAGSSAQFQFRYDNTPPTNPGFITAPSQFVQDKAVTMTWPTTGGDAASDANSGLIGLQYRIGSGGTWYGDPHSGAQDTTDLLANDGSYTTTDPPDFANIHEGNNVVYFRSWDAAGNVSSVYPTTVIKLNTISPSSPQNLTPSPSTNTTNSFAFSWADPNTFSGAAGNLTYCYTFNTTPSAITCTWTNPGIKTLTAGPYATQPGANTVYVVAKDEAGNVNYATAASAEFTADTSAPGLPLDVEIADVSTRITSNWKLALSWAPPTDVGASVASYRIYRSTNGISYSQVATTAGTSYVDGNLSQLTYSYKISACDSANNCGATSSVVSKLPTGRFTTAAALTANAKVINLSTRKATVTWSTDRDSDSKVSIGTRSGEYDPFQIASPTQTTDHEVTLNNLSPGTTYFAKSSWTDVDGNIGMSDEFSFKTQPAPSTQEVAVIRAGLSTAQLKFTSTDAAKVIIQYGRSDSFGGSKSISTSLTKSSYEAELVGLDDGSKYFFRLNTFDADGNEYPGGTIFTFTTPARPVISNLAFQPVDGEPTSTQRVSWKTNVPTSSLLRYAATGAAQEEMSESTLVTEHEITVKNLKDDTLYSLSAESRDAGGNLATSDIQTLRTALDTRPPKVTDVKVETTVRGTGTEARGQIVVSWKTDEPATSQVAYGQGSGLRTFNNRSSEDATLTTEHIVIIADLATSRVYTVQPVSKDRSGNGVDGPTRSGIIGRASDSVISIVLNALRGIFGY